MRVKFPQKEREMEEAITMLVNCVSKHCRNPKPLILHSIKTGLELFRLNQSKEIIIAGVLHDLIEDTNCKIGLIKNSFGEDVADLVSALTQEKIKDYKKRWHILIDKIKKAGRGAMLIKLVDVYDNLTYLPLIKSPQVLKIHLWKYQLVRDSFRPFLGKLKAFREFEKRYKTTIAELRKKKLIK